MWVSKLVGVESRQAKESPLTVTVLATPHRERERSRGRAGERAHERLAGRGCPLPIIFSVAHPALKRYCVQQSVVGCLASVGVGVGVGVGVEVGAMAGAALGVSAWVGVGVGVGVGGGVSRCRRSSVAVWAACG